MELTIGVSSVALFLLFITGVVICCWCKKSSAEKAKRQELGLEPVNTTKVVPLQKD